MKLKSLTIENFRAYKDPSKISFDDLTTIIGRNDIGKSTILEALEIFFNNETVKIDQTDANVRSDSKKVIITAEFTDIPSEITLDAGAVTTLENEFLTSEDGTLLTCSRETSSILG